MVFFFTNTRKIQLLKLMRLFLFSNLKFHSSLRHDPVQVVFNPGETSWVSNFTTSRGTEGDNSNLLPLLSSLGHLRLHVQRATRVSVACSLSSSGVNADNSGSDNSVDIIAGAVGDDRTVFNHSEGWPHPVQVTSSLTSAVSPAEGMHDGLM